MASHARSFSNRRPEDYDGPNGVNWTIKSWPMLLDPEEDQSVLVWLAGDREVFFDQVGGSYVPRHGMEAGVSLTHDTTNDLYVIRLANNAGDVVYEFQDYDQTTYPQGLIKSATDSQGEVIEVTTYIDIGITEIQKTVTDGGDTTVFSLLYEYYTSGAGTDQIQYVTQRKKVNAGSWENIERAEYTYHDGTDSHGTARDLKTATKQHFNGTTWDSTAVEYYRYYKSGDTNGDAHLLQYVVGAEGYRRMKEDSLNPLTATDAQIADYAEYYYEYDGDRLISSATSSAGCSSCGGGQAAATWSRTENPNYPTTPTDIYNTWKWKATYTTVEGHKSIIYSNAFGAPMLEVDQQAGSANEWLTFTKYESTGSVVLRADHVAVTGYDELEDDLLEEVGGNYVYLDDNNGLYQITEYYTSTDGGLSETTSGGVEGYAKALKLKNGETGTEIKVNEFEYYKHATTSDGTVYPIAKRIEYPSDTNQTITITRSFSYTWNPTDSLQLESSTVTNPVVSTAQNGSGSATTSTMFYDDYGREQWVRDERDALAYREYDAATGHLIKSIQDVDTTQTSDFSDLPAGWSTVATTGFGNHLITDYIYDAEGRLVEVLGPVYTIDTNGDTTNGDHAIRTANWTVYIEGDEESLDETWSGQGYYNEDSSTYVLIDPVTITKSDKLGRSVETIVSKRSSGSGKLSDTNTFSRSDWHTWATNQHNDGGQLISSRAYHNIPASGDGSSGTNYAQTDYTHDSTTGRQIAVETPDGTIQRMVYDHFGRISSQWVGTDDSGATASDPDGSGGANNMVVLVENEFDSGNDGGNGNLTEVTQHVDGTTTRTTSFTYDWRNRRIASDGEIDLYATSTYDNLERVTKTERYDTNSMGNLIARAETKYDELGRTYETIIYAVDPDTGTVGSSLTTENWYDEAGNLIKSIGGGSGDVFTKTVYDGLGRATATYLGYDIDETSYADADDVTGDTVMQQSEMMHDDGGNAILTTSYRRRADKTTETGALTSTTAIRIYVASWPDGLGRTIATANYGTNGGSALTYPANVPTRSDTVLVVSTQYNDAGQAYKVTSPGGTESRNEFDDMGRLTKSIENYDDGDPTTGTADKDRTTEFTFTLGGQRETITAKAQNASDDQVTTYVYGTATGGITPEVYRNDLLRATIYPDSDDPASLTGNGTDSTYDRVELKYNRLGQLIEQKDQLGTVRAFDYDDLGRRTQDRVTTFGTGVDQAVKRIAWSYDELGFVESVTSYDNATVGSGSVVNQVVYDYNDFGQLINDHQEHDGAKDGSTPDVQYAYANGSDNHTRSTSITYPDGEVFNYEYGTANGMNDILSRVYEIERDTGSVTLVRYGYESDGQIVKTDYPVIQVRHNLTTNAGAPDSSKVDRFGRTIWHLWWDYGSNDGPVDLKYGYDRESNRLFREDSRHTTSQDVYYTYDGLDRLIAVDRGDLNGGKTSISTLAFAQEWGLDPLGNWSSFKQDDNGNTTWDLNQSREHNEANEIADTSGDNDAITESAGSSWVDPAYNLVGNMTTIPQPADPSATFTATYDAWNRLVKLDDASGNVATYEYDGRNYRIEKIDKTGMSDITYDYYYSSGWQVLEVRKDDDTDPYEQYVWGQGYIDDQVLRDRDTNTDGTVGDTIYTLHDANWNVVALTDTAGDVQERYRYTAYGQSTVLDVDYSADADGVSDYDNQVMYAGYRFDPESGLYHVRYRYYHSMLGRWVTRDPAGNIDGLHLTNYLTSATTSAVDPLGLFTVVSTATYRQYNQSTSDLDLSVRGAPYTELFTNGHNQINSRFGTSIPRSWFDYTGGHPRGLASYNWQQPALSKGVIGTKFFVDWDLCIPRGSSGPTIWQIERVTSRVGNNQTTIKTETNAGNAVAHRIAGLTSAGANNRIIYADGPAFQYRLTATIPTKIKVDQVIRLLDSGKIKAEFGVVTELWMTRGAVSGAWNAGYSSRVRLNRLFP